MAPGLVPEGACDLEATLMEGVGREPEESGQGSGQACEK